MSTLINAIYIVPEFLRELFTGPDRLYAVITAAVFLIVLLFSNKVVTVLRDLFVLAAVVYGVICYFRRIYPMFWVCVIALLILAVFRLLRYIIVTVYHTTKTRKIERAALAKAEKRRGSWKDRRGYSGSHPEEEKETVQPDASEAADSRSSEADRRDMPPANETIPRADEPLTREQALSAAHKLKDLNDLGILTEEEYNQIKARLYSRLG